MNKYPFDPLDDFPARSHSELRGRAADFLAGVSTRRTVRQFSEKAVPIEVIQDCIRAASTAPSGANMQPWHFVVVSSPEVKQKIREAAENEEREFYHRRAPDEWLEALEPFATDENKPFLESAPYLIAIFSQLHGFSSEGEKIKHYYVKESVGIATGILITALHTAGLATLTHTPSPMKFLNRVLDRPSNETPFLLLVAGYPSEDAVVPRIGKKPLEEISTHVD